MNSFSFNAVIIIESISPNSPLLYSVGITLFNKIDGCLNTLKQSNNKFQDCVCEIHHINGLSDWNTFWKELTNRCQNGLKPIIHFVCHGSSDGKSLVLNDHDANIFLPWGDVCEKLECANIQNHNNTFVTMCICHGFFILYKLLVDQRRIPFCGLIASPDTITNVDADIRYSDFYIALLTNSNVSQAFQAIINDLQKVSGLIGEDKTARILIKYSDELFIDAFSAEFLKRKDPRIAYDKAKQAILSDDRFKGLSTDEVEEAIQDYLKLYDKEINAIYTKLRDYKFMFDLYPEERLRFNFPEQIKV